MQLMIQNSTQILQLLGIVIVALILGVITQLIYKKFSDQSKLKEINELIKELQARIKEITDNDEKMKMQSKILSLSQSKFKYTMKPMMVSSVLFIAAFPFIRKLFKGFTLLVFEKSYPVIGSDVGWLLTYIMISIITSTVIRKKMGVHL